MIVALTGGTGFLGKLIFKKLKQNNIVVQNFDVRNRSNLNYFLKTIKRGRFDFVINSAANLSPKTDWDFNINQNLSQKIQNSISDCKTKLFHISTINITNKKFNDSYTNSKRVAESKLIRNDKLLILRPSLIIDKNFNISNSFFEKYTNLPFKYLPMIYPGSVYFPILDSCLADFIVSQIKRNQISNDIYNIIGKKEYKFWEIFNNFCKGKNKNALKINLNIFSKLRNKKMLNLFYKNSILQNLIQLKRFESCPNNGKFIKL